MRTLNQPSGARPPDDRGAVLVIVAVIMVALLGIGALVIDLGALYVERRELQNGADAAALAIAQDCAGGDCGAAFATAEQFADLNAKDGLSTVDFVCGVGPGLQACTEPPPPGVEGALGWVRVTTSTETPDGDQVDFVLAPVMSTLTGSTVHADAVAAWGPLGGLQTIPLAISECEYLAFFGDDAPTTGVTFTVYFHTNDGARSCDHGPSGADAPGGFGWLEQTGDCEATVSSGSVPGDPGNDLGGCDPATWLGAEKLILPVFSTLTEGLQGRSVEYDVVGFVSFTLKGYHLSGNVSYGHPNAPCNNPDRCISGIFKEFGLLSSGEFGGGNFGVMVVKMVG